MISKLKYYISQETNPYENLAVEKYLMFHAPKDTCILYLWQNERTVVIGRNQNSFKECRVEGLLEDGGHLARRLSGGGAVFHDLGNLNFTFCARLEDYDVGRQMEVLLLALRRLGIAASLSGRNDITVDGRKVSGNAFYKKGGFCCHHGTILINADMEMLGRYLNVSNEKLKSNGVLSVRSRVTNLKDCAGAPKNLSVAQVGRAVVSAFGEVYLSAFPDAPPGAPEPLILPCSAALEICRDRERFEDQEWIYGKHIQFTQEFSGKFSWGEVTIQLRITGDKIEDAAIYSDALDQEAILCLSKMLHGCPFHREALEAVILAAAKESGGSREIWEDIWGLFYGK